MVSSVDKILNDVIMQRVDRYGIEETARHYNKPKELIEEYIYDLNSRYSPSYFAKYNLKIRTMRGELIGLHINKAQRRIQEAIDRQASKLKPIRIKIPKSRRQGVSTYIQGNMFGSSIYGKHIELATICHDLDSARQLRDMFERYYQNYPRQKPSLKKVSEKYWRFSQKDVGYLIDTAEELDTGRAFTLHQLHLSEVAFYRHPETLMTGLLTAVDDNPNTAIFAESTANGLGGWWYDFIFEDNDYELIFLAWHEDNNNNKNFESEQEKLELEKDLTAEERNLIDNFKVTLEQLNWRRHKIKNTYNGNEDNFRQEYPATLEEGFLTSGRCYFPTVLINENFINARKYEPKVGWLTWKKRGESVDFDEDISGWWKIWEFPNTTDINRYVTGTDPAEGRLINKQNREPDNTVITVYDRLTGKVCAEYCAKADPEVVADEIYKASIMYGSIIDGEPYGSACDCIERNNSGLAVIQKLKEYNNLFLYRKENVGQIEDKELVDYGHDTKKWTREYLLTDLRAAIKTKRFMSNSVEFWKECQSFVYDKDGKPRAQEGRKDDRVLSAALAIKADQQATEYSPLEIKKEKPITDNTDQVGWEEEEVCLVAEF